MTERNPPFALQNAGATHTAEGDRMLVSGLFAGARTSGSLISAGGVNMSLSNAFNCFQTGTPSMAVIVSAGVCYVPGTEASVQGLYCCVNDATVTKTVDPAHGTLPRVDSVIARVYDSQYSGATNTWAIEVVTGTAASSPTAPTLPANSLRLWNINVPAAVSTIISSYLSDQRIYATAVGGVISCTEANKPALNTVPEGQAIWLRDAPGTLQIKYAGAWVTRGNVSTSQSGSTSVSFTSKNSHTYNVTFPTPFASMPKVFGNINNAAGSTGRWIPRAYNISTTGFTMFLFHASDTTTTFTWSGVEVQWFATL